MTDDNIDKLAARIGRLMKNVSTDEAHMMLSNMLFLVAKIELFDGDGHAAALSLSDWFRRVADAIQAQETTQ